MPLPKIVDGVTRKSLPGDEEVLMTTNGATALIINATGAAVLDLCDGSRSAVQIASFIAEHVPGVTVEAVQTDVERIIGELKDAGLLESG